MKKEDYELLESNVKKGTYLSNETQVKLPALPKCSTEEMQAYQGRCQEVLDMQSGKINALKAQLASEKKKLESKSCQEKSNALVIDFNSKLEEKYRKLLKKYEEESHDNKKAIEALQELSDKVLEENKKLKEENDSLNEAMEIKIGQIEYRTLSDEEWEQHEKERREYEEYDADREPSVVRHIVNYCIEYVSNIENVQDSHVDSIKEMLESLLDNSFYVERMKDSDKLKLTKKLHGIKKNRKEMEIARKKEMKEADNTTITNNYFGSIGIKADCAGAINNK